MDHLVDIVPGELVFKPLNDSISDDVDDDDNDSQDLPAHQPLNYIIPLSSDNHSRASSIRSGSLFGGSDDGGYDGSQSLMGDMNSVTGSISSMPSKAAGRARHHPWGGGGGSSNNNNNSSRLWSKNSAAGMQHSVLSISDKSQDSTQDLSLSEMHPTTSTRRRWGSSDSVASGSSSGSYSYNHRQEAERTQKVTAQRNYVSSRTGTIRRDPLELSTRSTQSRTTRYAREGFSFTGDADARPPIKRSQSVSPTPPEQPLTASYVMSSLFYGMTHHQEESDEKKFYRESSDDGMSSADDEGGKPPPTTGFMSLFRLQEEEVDDDFEHEKVKLGIENSRKSNKTKTKTEYDLDKPRQFQIVVQPDVEVKGIQGGNWQKAKVGQELEDDISNFGDSDSSSSNSLDSLDELLHPELVEQHAEQPVLLLQESIGSLQDSVELQERQLALDPLEASQVIRQEAEEQLEDLDHAEAVINTFNEVLEQDELERQEYELAMQESLPSLASVGSILDDSDDENEDVDPSLVDYLAGLMNEVDAELNNPPKPSLTSLFKWSDKKNVDRVTRSKFRNGEDRSGEKKVKKVSKADFMFTNAANAFLGVVGKKTEDDEVVQQAASALLGVVGRKINAKKGVGPRRAPVVRFADEVESAPPEPERPVDVHARFKPRGGVPGRSALNNASRVVASSLKKSSNNAVPSMESTANSAFSPTGASEVSLTESALKAKQVKNSGKSIAASLTPLDGHRSVTSTRQADTNARPKDTGIVSSKLPSVPSPRDCDQELQSSKLPSVPSHRDCDQELQSRVDVASEVVQSELQVNAVPVSRKGVPANNKKLGTTSNRMAEIEDVVPSTATSSKLTSFPSPRKVDQKEVESNTDAISKVVPPVQQLDIVATSTKASPTRKKKVINGMNATKKEKDRDFVGATISVGEMDSVESLSKNGVHRNLSKENKLDTSKSSRSETKAEQFKAWEKGTHTPDAVVVSSKDQVKADIHISKDGSKLSTSGDKKGDDPRAFFGLKPEPQPPKTIREKDAETSFCNGNALSSGSPGDINPRGNSSFHCVTDAQGGIEALKTANLEISPSKSQKPGEGPSSEIKVEVRRKVPEKASANLKNTPLSESVPVSSSEISVRAHTQRSGESSLEEGILTIGNSTAGSSMKQRRIETLPRPIIESRANGVSKSYRSTGSESPVKDLDGSKSLRLSSKSLVVPQIAKPGLAATRGRSASSLRRAEVESRGAEPVPMKDNSGSKKECLSISPEEILAALMGGTTSKPFASERDQNDFPRLVESETSVPSPNRSSKSLNTKAKGRRRGSGDDERQRSRSTDSMSDSKANAAVSSGDRRSRSPSSRKHRSSSKSERHSPTIDPSDAPPPSTEKSKKRRSLVKERDMEQLSGVPDTIHENIASTKAYEQTRAKMTEASRASSDAMLTSLNDQRNSDPSHAHRSKVKRSKSLDGVSLVCKSTSRRHRSKKETSQTQSNIKRSISLDSISSASRSSSKHHRSRKGTSQSTSKHRQSKNGAPELSHSGNGDVPPPIEKEEKPKVRRSKSRDSVSSRSRSSPRHHRSRKKVSELSLSASGGNLSSSIAADKTVKKSKARGSESSVSRSTSHHRKDEVVESKGDRRKFRESGRTSGVSAHSVSHSAPKNEYSEKSRGGSDVAESRSSQEKPDFKRKKSRHSMSSSKKKNSSSRLSRVTAVDAGPQSADKHQDAETGKFRELPVPTTSDRGSTFAKSLGPSRPLPSGVTALNSSEPAKVRRKNSRESVSSTRSSSRHRRIDNESSRQPGTAKDVSSSRTRVTTTRVSVSSNEQRDGAKLSKCRPSISSHFEREKQRNSKPDKIQDGSRSLGGPRTKKGGSRTRATRSLAGGSISSRSYCRRKVESTRMPESSDDDSIGFTKPIFRKAPSRRKGSARRSS